MRRLAVLLWQSDLHWWYVHSPLLTLLHSERPKLHTILAFLSAIGLIRSCIGCQSQDDAGPRSAVGSYRAPDS